MEKITNKDFWEKEEIIKTQEKVETATDYEYFLFEKVNSKNSQNQGIRSIKIFGCGTGREIKAIYDFFKPSKILASDISENMIRKCQFNLENWGIDKITETLTINATDFQSTDSKFDLVTIMNSMMTYVPFKKDRIKIFENSYSILSSKGILIGTVHHQIGTPTKTLYFKIRKFFSFFLRDRVGNRNTGFEGFKVPGYYYDKETLITDIKSVGFSNVEVWSLAEYYKLIGKNYNLKKGFNNLIFIAQKG